MAPVVSCSSSELPAVGHCKHISSQNVFFSYLGLLTQGLLFSCFSLLYIMMTDSPAEFVFFVPNCDSPHFGSCLMHTGITGALCS